MAKGPKIFPEARQLLGRCLTILKDNAAPTDKRILFVRLTEAKVETEAGNWLHA